MQMTNEKILINSSNKLPKEAPLKPLNSLFVFMAAWLLGALLFISPAMAGSTETLKEELLTAIEKKYGGKGFQADFTQVSKLAALDMVETASGQVWFSHPGKMRWLYLTPDQHEIITNGKLLWIFRPAEDQVMQGSAKNFFKSGAGGAFLSDIGLIRENFTVEVTGSSDTRVDLVLTPKKQDPDLTSMVIQVSSATHEILQVTTHNPYGDTTLFEFTRIQFKPMDPAQFEFKVPQGSNIVEME